MIAQPKPQTQPARWQQRLAAALRDRDELLARLGLDAATFAAAHTSLPRAARARPGGSPDGQPAAGGPGHEAWMDETAVPAGIERGFPLRVPLEYVARMRFGDPHDPLLLQVLPRSAELMPHADTLLDPVGDAQAEVMPGLLHKYAGRVLLVLTGACAVHCRYCFRRDYPYAGAQASPARLGAALAWIESRSDVHEVILSGGDPLSLPDQRLSGLVERLDAIPHLARLRIHTRLPVVLPERVDAALLGWLAGTRLAKAMVLHVNHAQEIDHALAAACARLRGTGVQLLNQAVLLAGVNDTVEALAALSARLFDCGVLPYYLHALDRAHGVMHFGVTRERGLELMAALRERLPGYLVPRHVVEVAGAASKLELR